MAYPFTITPTATGNAVSINHVVKRQSDGLSIVPRSCADAPFVLEESDWPEGLAHSVARRLEENDGQAKGRVLALWRDRDGRRLDVIAACAWHVHEGNWPACLLDAGYALALPEEQGKPLVEASLFPAVRDLARDGRLQDRKVPRPADHLGWAVRSEKGAGDLKARKQRARAVATRATLEYRFEKVDRRERPSWVDGFYGRRTI